MHRTKTLPITTVRQATTNIFYINNVQLDKSAQLNFLRRLLDCYRNHHAAYGLPRHFIPRNDEKDCLIAIAIIMQPMDCRVISFLAMTKKTA